MLKDNIMFTTIDKALVALVMGVLSILNLKFGFNLGFEENTISAIIGVLTPFLVWFTPNRTG